ncbi:IclR family transcriptional regulator [Photobacterium aphoticum]|uniref:HTH-type transcriptional repressor AllR n=2 Tax=Photobacterium aphoticum TaxID=754436 RepID=A0A0J1GUD4_9GAMM|nr:IclR family transcriptional regulator [Photobacterium aphoticum]KLV03044.1 IclR family transcriptional regulator [Photobacterium aphoticum]PSU57974.1 IclR family transcriptional regulator [Photobacterium aphoticum]
MTNKYKLNANEKMLQVLMHIASANEPVTAQTLSEQTGMPPSSVYRYLVILKNWNLIEESPRQSCYSIGPAALQLLRNFQMFSPLSSGVHQVLKRVQQQTGEMAAYLVPVGFRALCTARVDSPHALRCAYEEGQSQPLIRGASSKVILAHMPEQRVMSTLHHFGITEPEDVDRWQSELAQIKHDGYAISTSEYDPGVSGVSAPVFSGNKIVGAVSVMAPEDRVIKRKNKIIFSVLQAARVLPPDL